jgi:hypothetical protein
VTVDDGVTGVSALNDLLDDYRVPPGSRATILEAVATVQADGIPVVGRVAPGGAVSLAPPDAVTAASVQPNQLSLTLDRRSALRSSQQHEFCRFEDGADGRALIVMEQWAVQQHAVAVRQLIVAAFRSAGPPPAPAPARGGRSAARSDPSATPAAAPTARKPAARRGTSAAARPPAAPERPAPPKPAVCPIHFVQLVNGSCDYCD